MTSGKRTGDERLFFRPPFTPRLRRASHAHRSGVMSEHSKCPMGNHPWLATFFVLTFLMVFLAHKLGLL